MQLYRYATGWLGWKPAEALAASPQEINQALDGKSELMRLQSGQKPKPEKRNFSSFKDAIAGRKVRREKAKES